MGFGVLRAVSLLQANGVVLLTCCVCVSPRALCVSSDRCHPVNLHCNRRYWDIFLDVRTAAFEWGYSTAFAMSSSGLPVRKRLMGR